MKKYSLIVLSFFFGITLTYFLMKQFQRNDSFEQSHVLAYEIQKLNKLVVAEQTFSDVYTHKSSKYLPRLKNIYSADKKVILLISVKAQATYDLKQMKIKVDSIKKTIHINYIPPLEIKTYSDVQFYDLDQSTFNKFQKDELNEIKKRGVEHIEKTIDRSKLEEEAHRQLIENLSNIYLTAHLYGWKVKDETTYAKELENRMKKDLLK